MKSLNDLPSSRSWSFPPRPWTHHIRRIEPDSNNPDYVFAAIEAGALVQSHDGGKTWIDRNEEQGPYDTHTLATHSKAPCLTSGFSLVVSVLFSKERVNTNQIYAIYYKLGKKT